MIAAAVAILFGGYYMVDRAVGESSRPMVRLVFVAVITLAFFGGLQRYVPDFDRTVDITKAVIAICAAGCVFYELHRAGMKRPVAERWKRFVGVTLGVMAIVAYFNGFKFGYPKFYHRWDQYHYYMGAKYFRELGYDGLYKCGVIAEDQLGVVEWKDEDSGARQRLDMRAEVRHPDKKIRNLGGDNLLMPVTEVLEHPEACVGHMTPERWTAFKEDVKFFRIASDKQYWEDMQKDHGYNPPPVWTILGSIFANMHPAATSYLQFLAMIDIGFLIGTFGLLWWAFGWRVFAVSAIFWGTQSPAPFYWTGGAFLRQDWLFWIVAAAAFTRKRYYALAGGSMVYAGLLRVFPGLAVVGWVVALIGYVLKKKRMSVVHKRMLLGGVLAAAVLIPASLKVAGADSYTQFYKHTLEVHDHTPLTNHMGLRVLVAHDMEAMALEKLGGRFTTGASGRMKYTKDPKLNDPFEVWKRMREERYAKYKWVAYGITALTLAFFFYVVRRIRSMWIAQCLGQIFIILLSQLTCYYYSFMILTGPLSKANRKIEVPLFGLAALSQFVWVAFGYYDDRYTVLTLICLGFCYYLIGAFAPSDTWPRIKALFGSKPAEESGASA
jgi:hypothetical protein